MHICANKNNEENCNKKFSFRFLVRYILRGHGNNKKSSFFKLSSFLCWVNSFIHIFILLETDFKLEEIEDKNAS